jgi:hypothetical protein
MATGTSPTNSANTFASLLGPSTTPQANNQSLNLIGKTDTGASGFFGGLMTGFGLNGNPYGSVPGVANPLSSANTAVVGNQNNLGNIANLTQGADTISAAGAALPFDMNLPGYQQNLGQAATNTGQELQGQVPQDVQNLLAQQAAERGAGTGQGAGSPNTNADYLQSLGLTSLGQEQTGMGNLSSLIGETPTGAAFNPASMFVTPTAEQGANQAVQNALAAPNPSDAGGLATIASLF